MVINKVLKKELGSVKRQYVILKKWNALLSDFKYFLQNNYKVKNKGGNSDLKIGILITPWMGLPVPQYAFALGMLLRYSGYSNITFVMNDLWKKNKFLYPLYMKQLNSFEQLLKKEGFSEYNYNILKLSECQESKISETDKELIAWCSNINTIKHVGNSLKNKEYDRVYKIFKETYYNMFEKIKTAVGLEWDRFILPGGAFQETGIFFSLLRKRKINVITYDSGENVLLLGINGYAAQKVSVGNSVEYLKQKKEKMEYAIERAKTILYNRMNGKNEISLNGKGMVTQSTSYHEHFDLQYDVVILTNLEFDTAALGTHDVFKNDFEWVEETVDYVLRHTGNSIAVRDHPHKRLFPYVETSMERLKNNYKGNERFRFFSYRDEVNSYNLISHAKVIIVNTSTIGIEAGMLGKNVVTESHSYYKNASFIKFCDSRNAYFNAIKQYLSKNIELSETARQEAALYYFLSQECTQIESSFTPQPQNYRKWSKMDMGQLLKKENADVFIKVITSLKPLEVLILEAMDGKYIS